MEERPIELYLAAMATGLLVSALCERGLRREVANMRMRATSLHREGRLRVDPSGVLFVTTVILSLLGVAFLKLDIQLLFMAITLVLSSISRFVAQAPPSYVAFVGVASLVLSAIEVKGLYTTILLSAVIAAAICVGRKLWAVSRAREWRR